MITLALDYLARPLVRFGGAAALILAAVTMWNVAENRAEKRGEERGETKAFAKVENKNATAKQAGQRGASNGGKRVSGSVRDPGYRAE